MCLQIFAESLTCWPPDLFSASLWTLQICVLLALHQLTCTPTLSPLPSTSKCRALGRTLGRALYWAASHYLMPASKHLNTLWFWRPRQCPNITPQPSMPQHCLQTHRGQQSTCGHIIKTYRTNCLESGHSKNTTQRKNSQLHFPGNKGKETLGKKWIPNVKVESDCLTAGEPVCGEGDHTWPWICPLEFLERPLSLVSDGEQIETGILGCSGLMFSSSQV